jgi:hypothetical protein
MGRAGAGFFHHTTMRIAAAEPSQDRYRSRDAECVSPLLYECFGVKA